jgi:hypothetical protein
MELGVKLARRRGRSCAPTIHALSVDIDMLETAFVYCTRRVVALKPIDEVAYTPRHWGVEPKSDSVLKIRRLLRTGFRNSPRWHWEKLSNRRRDDRHCRLREACGFAPYIEEEEA